MRSQRNGSSQNKFPASIIGTNIRILFKIFKKGLVNLEFSSIHPNFIRTALYGMDIA